MDGFRPKRILGWGGVLLAVALPAQAGAFHPEKLGEGVHLFRPTQPGTGHVNSLVVEREDGLLVVESQPSPAAARELMAAIAAVSSSPLRYLILSHAHAESAGGASAFPESTIVAGSVNCRSSLLEPTFDFGAEIRRRTSPWTSPPRRPPVLLVTGQTILADAKNPVELLVLSPAHTGGDLMVFLPSLDLYHVGSLLFSDHNPYAGDPEADVSGWLASLNSLARRSPKLLTALAGPVVSIEELRKQRDSFAWVRGVVQTGFIDRLPPEEIRQRVREEQKLGVYFDPEAEPFFLDLLLDKVIDESQAQRQKREPR